MTYATRQVKGKTEVQDIDGKWRTAQDYHESLEQFPSHAQKFMSINGEPCLVNVVSAPPECGCKVVGCGTIQFPITIQFCDRHDTF